LRSNTGKSSQNSPSCNEAGYLAHHHLLHGVSHYCWMSSSLRRPPSPKFAIHRRRQSIAIRHRRRKRRN
jgi:hypothetical protein